MSGLLRGAGRGEAPALAPECTCCALWRSVYAIAVHGWLAVWVAVA